MLVDAAAAAAVIVAVGSFLAPSDAAAATTTSFELVSQAAAVTPDIGAIVAKAGKASLGGGASGAAAAVIQVLSLMWLRTTMNFQVRFTIPSLGTELIGIDRSARVWSIWAKICLTIGDRRMGLVTLVPHSTRGACCRTRCTLGPPAPIYSPCIE